MAKKLRYVNKLVINGAEVSTSAKQVACNINATDVTLNCTYISDIELTDAYTSSFKLTAKDKNIEVHYAKAGNKISASIYINETLVFSSLSMQGVFTALNAAYGISKSSLNNLYIKSNTTRKQTTASTAKTTVATKYEF